MELAANLLEFLQLAPEQKPHKAFCMPRGVKSALKLLCGGKRRRAYCNSLLVTVREAGNLCFRKGTEGRFSLRELRTQMIERGELERATFRRRMSDLQAAGVITVEGDVATITNWLAANPAAEKMEVLRLESKWANAERQRAFRARHGSSRSTECANSPEKTGDYKTVTRLLNPQPKDINPPPLQPSVADSPKASSVPEQGQEDEPMDFAAWTAKIAVKAAGREDAGLPAIVKHEEPAPQPRQIQRAPLRLVGVDEESPEKALAELGWIKECVAQHGFQEPLSEFARERFQALSPTREEVLEAAKAALGHQAKEPLRSPVSYILRAIEGARERRGDKSHPRNRDAQYAKPTFTPADYAECARLKRLLWEELDYTSWPEPPVSVGALVRRVGVPDGAVLQVVAALGPGGLWQDAREQLAVYGSAR